MKNSRESEADAEQRAQRDGARTMRGSLFAVLGSALALSLGAAGFYGVKAGFGVAIGGGIAAANLWLLWKIVDAFLRQKGKAAPWALVAVIKMTGLFGGVWLLLKSGMSSGLWLAVGYGSLPLGITLGSLFGARPEEEGSPGDESAKDVVKARPRDAEESSDEKP